VVRPATRVGLLDLELLLQPLLLSLLAPGQPAGVGALFAGEATPLTHARRGAGLLDREIISTVCRSGAQRREHQCREHQCANHLPSLCLGFARGERNQTSDTEKKKHSRER
jgi:hypothetical protein